MKEQIFCGRGTDFPYKDVMKLLNTCFNFTDPASLFEGLLPKCYREEYRPQDSNYIVAESDGTLAAAVGAYDHEIVVCGRSIPCRGIGNVGVHPDHRHKGYMKLAMNSALNDMISDGVALSTLGGLRQRYQYFGFDKVGPTYIFSVSDANVRHYFGSRTPLFTVREVKAPDDSIIDNIIALNERQDFLPIRPKERYLDIANSWHASLLAILDGERFVGYCINDGNTLSEIQIDRDEDFLEALLSIHGYIGKGYALRIPPYQHSYACLLTPFSEYVSIGSAMSFNVLNYRLILDAFLALKLTYTTLPDGELSFLIHGYARDERLCISVKNGKHSVEAIPDSQPVDFEFSHTEGMTFLFASACPMRDTAPGLAQIWFPLPINMYRADEV